MEQNKDHSNAAVRGEAVACKFCDGEGVIHTGIDEAPSRECRRCDGSGIAPASVPAADAPSEPSELKLLEAAIESLDRFAEFDGEGGGVCPSNDGQFILRSSALVAIQEAAKVKSRAADALDSQPTEPDGLPPLPEPIEVGGEGWDFDDFKSEKTFSCEHMWAYARAAITSSQPTDGGVRNG